MTKLDGYKNGTVVNTVHFEVTKSGETLNYVPKDCPIDAGNCKDNGYVQI